MALEWVALGYVAAAEATMVLLLTVPGLEHRRKGLILASCLFLKLLTFLFPVCLYLMMDIYWKYETRPSCETPESCTWTGHVLHQISDMRSQRNVLLIFVALVFRRLLDLVTHLVIRIEQLNQRVKRPRIAMY